ncbi:mediator of RNA polymerase II transcription subunit 1 [Diorhabda carinulata]|uniref:mediator of RNA polymerase II transcription subunit 1 n=1 Tax=Diorhabda carinulata TaxID=1163345 RepID=UPI0025A02FCA|nr:mediator of RNA polymerase II transcription subunit 1 [Diorhabda carinulata]
MNRIQNANGIKNEHKDKAKDWQLEILMEKLRSKASQCKSLQEISKNVRMTLLEKRYASDSVEKSQHQKCLDTLQHCIKVTSLQSMVERLESLTRQLGLKFVVEPSGVFISSDMFYLEIVLGATGSVEDVKIHHEGKKEQQSCTELVNCLSKGDFSDFTAQLEGFTSIYQLNAEKKIKCKAFTALESLEADLITLSQLQTFIKEPFNLIHKSPVGILEKRKGGHPMKLTYFVSPYDLLNIEKNEIEPINIDTIINKNLGYSVTVCMEGSAAHKLQTTTLITVNKNINGKSTPSYAPVNSQNSAVIPACFLLKLNKPLPMCLSLIRKIQQIYPWTEVDSAPVQPMLNLIVSECSNNKMQSANNKGLFVTLPDQNHCYFMTESKNMEGVLVTTIPFTHPANVASILMILREQALFNTIISSCVRPNSKQDFENMTMFEVSALSSVHISISLEHPVEESMATAEIDLSDISNVICRIHSPSSSSPVHPPPDIATELSSKILNKSLSVPITLRSVIKLWEQQSMKRNHYGGHENFNLPLGSGDPGGPKDPTGTNLVEFGGLNDKIKQESSGNSGHNMMMQASQDMFLNETMMSSNFPNFPPSDGVLTTLELTNILSENVDKDSKRQKRKHDDSNKSGKRKVGTEESDILESSSCDSTSRSTPVSQETEIRTPNSILGFHTDLELSSLDPMDLLNVTDKHEAFENLDDLDLEEISTKDFKGENEETTLNLPNDVEETIHGISITPITSVKEKRPTSDPLVVTDTLTITPVMNSIKNPEEKTRDRKSKSLRDEKNKLEKKRKRKRDESPMGPPEKVPHKQEFSAKPIGISLKSTESPPASTPSSPSAARKFSPPVPNRPSSLSGKLSPNMMKSSSIKSSSSHHSPKHSPAHIPSSPKQNLTELSSPKHLGSSPKHPSVTGSGKPSMSALKNAANSPSGKSGTDSKSKCPKDSSRDKDKKTSNAINILNQKIKTSSNKSKSLESNVSEMAIDNSSSPNSNVDPSKINSNQLRINRKGSLSAIVDKLKVNAQHCDNASDITGKSSGNKDRTISKLSESGKGIVKIGDVKNSEYMVKPSSDGMKITINKTRSKDNSSGKQSGLALVNKANSTNSPKTHTGLKPGVNSGPASKKPQVQKSTNSYSPIPTMNSSSNTAGSGSSSKTFSPSAKSTSTNYSKSSSGSSCNSNSTNLSKSNSKITSSPKLNSSIELNRSKDKIKFGKTNSEKSLLSSLRESRKSSPILSREEADNVYKISQSTLMEGRIKTLDKNFQIPKLSARISDEKKSVRNDGTNITNRDKIDQKVYDTISKNDSKYLIGNQLFDNSAVRNNLQEINEDNQGKKEVPHNLSTIQGSKEDNNRMESTSKLYPDPMGFSSTLLKNIDFTSSKFIAPAPRDERKDVRKNEEVLDFSAKPQQPLPQSPSVSVHIVKSPAPSPLINRSPLSASPGITDDELMDEALVGMGK